MEITEKAMYVKGLCDGMELDKSTKEGKAIAALLDLVSEMASAMDEMETKLSNLEDYVEELDEDLGDVEEVLVDGDDDMYEDEDEDEDEDDLCDGDCENCDFDCDADDEDGEEDDGDYFEVVCPSCGDVINFKSYSKSYKIKRRIANPEENRAVFLNVHESIIERATWEKVQVLQKGTRRRKPTKSNVPNIFP